MLVNEIVYKGINCIPILKIYLKGPWDDRNCMCCEFVDEYMHTKTKHPK